MRGRGSQGTIPQNRSGSTPARAVDRRRALIGACFGNAVEWYDFALYGAFASVLAEQFFPAESTVALAATFAIFAVTFVARPVGALVLGRVADRRGRRPVFSWSILLMSVATAAMAVLPTWSSVGLLAPVALVLLRLVQGFASGGEIPSSVIFLIESAPSGRRGLFGGWHLASIAVGLTGGYAAVAVLSAVLSDADLHSWGWRAAFMVAAPLGLVGRFIRRDLDETPAFVSVAAHRTPRLSEVFRGRRAAALQGFVLVAVLSLSFNLWFVYLPNHLVTSGVTTMERALALSVVGLCAAVVTAPMMGGLSDKVGRRPVLIGATLAMAAFAAPGFALIRSGSAAGMVASSVTMGVLVGSLAVSAFVGELFPVDVRVSGTALTYGVATALLGGSAPLVATGLMASGAAWAVPAYLATMAVLAFVAALSAGETAFGDLEHPSAA